MTTAAAVAATGLPLACPVLFTASVSGADKWRSAGRRRIIVYYASKAAHHAYTGL